ncbi:hypothetical protein LZ30DRAFT_713064 [Colletotrichum cereale]|nr:hypothetical protein LZ30DRAFT_713064 [Colletotrichum cereale]
MATWVRKNGRPPRMGWARLGWLGWLGWLGEKLTGLMGVVPTCAIWDLELSVVRCSFVWQSKKRRGCCMTGQELVGAAGVCQGRMLIGLLSASGPRFVFTC